MADTAELESVERWRTAARRAGRILGWHVRTGLVCDGVRVWAASDDFPLTEEHRRDAAKRITDALNYDDPPASPWPVHLTPVD